MAIHERIYVRLADPPRRRGRQPALAISRFGTRYATRGWFARLVLYGAVIPPIVFCFIIYRASQSEEATLQLISFISSGALNFPSFASIDDATWRRLGGILLFQVLWVQTWFAIFLVPFVGSRQIADDVRSHALEIYLSRPITALDYLLGKLLVVLRPVLLITVAPPLVVMAVAHLLLPDTFWPCLPLYPWALLTLLFWAVVNALVILGISATVSSARYATIIWFMLNMGTLLISDILQKTTGKSVFDLVAYTNNLLVVLFSLVEIQPFTSVDLPLTDPDRSPLPSFLILVTLALLGAWTVLRRARAGTLA